MPKSSWIFKKFPLLTVLCSIPFVYKIGSQAINMHVFLNKSVTYCIHKILSFFLAQGWCMQKMDRIFTCNLWSFIAIYVMHRVLISPWLNLIKCFILPSTGSNESTSNVHCFSFHRENAYFPAFSQILVTLLLWLPKSFFLIIFYKHIRKYNCASICWKMALGLPAKFKLLSQGDVKWISAHTLAKGLWNRPKGNLD